MTRPFLFSFARKCCSPSRIKSPQDYYYDEATDMVRFSGDPTHPLAISINGENGPQTKKCDIEKGDDNKDRRMWQ